MRPLLAVILIAYAMIVIDLSVTITALPAIRASLGMTEAALSWVQNAYLLTYGGFLLVGGRMGDLLGRRRIFIVGIAMFTLASVAVGLALSAASLLAARAAQGLAAALLAPSALALLQANFREGAERTRAVAYYSSMAGVGATLGLVLGGLVTAWLSWRAAFLVNGPVGILLIVAARRHVAETERHARKLDLLGATTSTLAMTALVYGLVRMASASSHEPLTVGILVGSAMLLVVFVVGQARARQPLMPLRLFASRERAGAYATRFVFVGAITGFLFFTTLYLQQVLELDPFTTGLAFVPMTLANFAGALAVPRLARRLTNAQILACAIVVTFVGMAWLSRLSGSGFTTSILLPMILIGAGGGASLAPLTAAGISGVAPADAGAAAGLVNATHQLGGSLGLGILLCVSSAGGSALTGAAVMLALALVIAVSVRR
jgi:EmrB/QacA subfamily drug resistance transporter